MIMIYIMITMMIYYDDGIDDDDNRNVYAECEYAFNVPKTEVK